MSYTERKAGESLNISVILPEKKLRGLYGIEIIPRIGTIFL
jgi:hypothetical protein